TWHEADFTDDTLNLFRVFACDPALESRLNADFKSLSTAENQRRAARNFAVPMTGLPVNTDPHAIAHWRGKYEAALASLSVEVKWMLSFWRKLVEPSGGRPPPVSGLRAYLGELIEHLKALIPSPAERAVYAPLLNAAEDVLVALEMRAPHFASRRSFLSKLN